MSQHDLEAKSCPDHNFVIWSLILNLFHRNDHFIETTCREQDLGRYTEGHCHSMTLQKNRVRPITCLFEVWFTTISQKWSPYLDDVSRTTFESIPWKPMSLHDLAAKSCPAHNFVIWSRISKLFHRNDHHIKTKCRAQHLGRYLEGQGHGMTLQQNHIRSITLFKVRFRNNFTEIITILRRRFACNIWRSRSQHDLSAK